ncbi:MAG: hypothetical protein K2G88_02335 [Oscillospiraceae bacterium]|nr:hypothetical protein [Oscillospiraceae bacterium]
MNLILILKLLPVLIAGICILLACLPKRYKNIAKPVITEAEIISQVTQKIYHNHSEIETIAPVVRYMTEQGEQVATSRQFFPEWQYYWKQGDKIKICYSKLQPSIFQICQDSKTQCKKLILLTIGIGILLAYAVLWVQYYE